jgi:hypothetical protein
VDSRSLGLEAMTCAYSNVYGASAPPRIGVARPRTIVVPLSLERVCYSHDTTERVPCLYPCAG